MAAKVASGDRTARRPSGRPSRPRTATRSKTGAKAKRWRSRAVTRLVEPGCGAICVACDEQVKFKARERLEQVICNVYVKGVWDRVEHFHAPCYTEAGEPYGPAATA